MQYTPRALPDDIDHLRECLVAGRFNDLILVGSSLRDADNGVPVTSHTVFGLPKFRRSIDDTIDDIISATRGTRRMMIHSPKRQELRLPWGAIVNLNICDQPWMMEADGMARRVPNGLSAIATNLMNGEVVATQLYHMDVREGTISQIRAPLSQSRIGQLSIRARADHDANVDHGNRIALSVQRKFPMRPIIDAHNGEVIVPAPGTRAGPA